MKFGYSEWIADLKAYVPGVSGIHVGIRVGFQLGGNKISTRCPRHCSQKRSITFSRFGWHKTETMRRARLTASSALVRDNYPNTMRCLAKGYEKLLVLNSFPAAHKQSLRTTNPVESKFATICHLDKRSKGCLSLDAMLSMMFKLGICAQHNWRRL